MEPRRTDVRRCGGECDLLRPCRGCLACSAFASPRLRRGLLSNAPAGAACAESFQDLRRSRTCRFEVEDLASLTCLTRSALWGAVGMLLSVPLTMTVKIALESHEDTHWIAVLLGSEAEAKASKAAKTAPAESAEAG